MSPKIATWTQRLTMAVALGMSCYHLYIAFVGTPNAIVLRSSHVGFALVLAFLTLPMWSRTGGREGPRVADILFMVAALAVSAYPILQLDYILNRFIYITPLNDSDVVVGIALLLLVLEATRRALGPILPLTALLFVGYALVFTGTNPEVLLEQLTLSTEGVYGIPAGVSATFIVLFIIFGALVERSGAGRLFMDFALSLTGSAAGGPAKVACITSGLFGSVSGSAVANVMTTGTFTIPLMKRIGYRPAFAGAVEAVASTGGQIMPPIMGAAAFVMAEFLGVSYLTVAGFALIPAVLYYVALFAAVHFEAKRTGMRGLPRSELPRVWDVLRERGHLFLPLLIILGVLFNGYSAQFAALCGIVSVIPTMLMRKTTRKDVTFTMIVEALQAGARGAVPVALACASAGIVIGVITLTGLGLDFTGLVVGIAQDTLFLALILTMVAGIILGMGMPTTPAYIVMVALLARALEQLGIPIEAAHLFLFYYAILSAITPPVAIAVYAANGLSGAGLWASSLAAVKLGATGYIVPFMFALGPALLMIGPWHGVAMAVATAVVGVVCLAASLHGYFLAATPWWQRLVLVAAAFVLIYPGLLTDGIGVGLVALVVAMQMLRPATPAPQPVDADRGG